MTLRSANVLDNFTTDAQFRAQCQVIHDHFAAAGMVQTADTGQINLTTVAKPAAINTVAGYEIWRFADTLQATAPIYFKFEYASGAVVSVPQFWITTGTSSDGAGTITVSVGTITVRKALLTGSTASGVTPMCYFDYLTDGTGFGLLMWPANTANMGGCLLVIERFRDADGAATDVGWNVITAGSGTTAPGATQDGRYHGSIATQPTSAITSWAAPYGGLGTANNSALFGTVLYPWPVFTGSSPRLGGPSQLLMVVGRTDLSATTSFSVTHYGTSHDWIAAGAGQGANGWGAALEAAGTLRSFVMRAD